MRTNEINIRSTIMDIPDDDPEPVMLTEARFIEIKDEYLELISDTYGEITQNHEKPGHTIAPRAKISRQGDLEGASFRRFSPNNDENRTQNPGARLRSCAWIHRTCGSPATTAMQKNGHPRPGDSLCRMVMFTAAPCDWQGREYRSCEKRLSGE